MPTYYFNKHKVEAFKPRVEIQYIAFRRIVKRLRPKSIRIEMIRCSEEYGIISAENGRSGFLLEKGRKSQHTDGTKFYIMERFFYVEEDEEELL